MYRGLENQTEVYSNGGWETMGSNQKVPDAKKARTSQGSTGMTLAEISNKCEELSVETISRGLAGPYRLRDGATHASPKF